MTRTLEPAMNSEHEEQAVRLANECARALLAYYQAEDFDGWRGKAEAYHKEWRTRCDRTWKENESAERAFVDAFPRYEWRDFAEKALLEAIERNRP